jgi:hypothetical protein
MTLDIDQNSVNCMQQCVNDSSKQHGRDGGTHKHDKHKLLMFLNLWVLVPCASNFRPDYGGKCSSQTSATQPTCTRCEHQKAGSTLP